MIRTYFGTDGIRGVANEFLTGELAFKCGNALAQLKEKALIIIGRDTRVSGDMLALSLASGAISGGADVYDLGIIPTAGVAYLAKQLGADFGVVISASHNPPEYNGIKVFSGKGYKLSEDEESKIESKLNSSVFVSNAQIGAYLQKFQLSDLYLSSITSTCVSGLKGFKVVLDMSNGASRKIAPAIFTRLGADVTAINTSKEGRDINEGCGSLHPEKLCKKVVECKADAGFAYDGDADRLIACDENGRVVDGDSIIYVLALAMKNNGLLKNNCVVGTTHTNMGIQAALKANGIELLRSDVGDKYVLELMLKSGSVLGGEQSGHIILTDLATTGDGILSSVALAQVIAKSKQPFSQLAKVYRYPQINVNIPVADKVRVLGSERVADALVIQRSILGDEGRVVVRASGTEQLIRVFAESRQEEVAENVCMQMKKVIEEIE